MKLGEALYKQSGAGAGTDGEVPNMDKDDDEDDIVDADFTEVGDDDKKSS
jgi:molecular chaperone DnaK